MSAAAATNTTPAVPGGGGNEAAKKVDDNEAVETSTMEQQGEESFPPPPPAKRSKKNDYDDHDDDDDDDHDDDENKINNSNNKNSSRDDDDDGSEEGAGTPAAATSTTTARTLLDDDNNNNNEKEDLIQKLHRLWASANSSSSNNNFTAATNNNNETAFEQTMQILQKEIDMLLKQGLNAYHKYESKCREMKEEITCRDNELSRLRSAEERSRTTIDNLFTKLETWRNETRDVSRAAVTEATLRQELATMTELRDAAVLDGLESRRKVALLEEQLSHAKTKLNRTTQQKLKMERDQRATMSLAKSLDNQSSTDSEYYKRKVTELNGYAQNLQSQLAEKNRQLAEMHRQMERNMSMNHRRSSHNNGGGLSSSSSNNNNFRP